MIVFFQGGVNGSCFTFHGENSGTRIVSAEEKPDEPAEVSCAALPVYVIVMGFGGVLLY
jgi:hypothetical protein